MALVDNILNYWKYDELSGNAADSVGGTTLTNTGSISYGVGKINNGAFNNDSTGKKLQGTLGYDPDTYASGFTIAGWYYRDASSGTDQQWWWQISENSGWGTCYVGNKGSNSGESGNTICYKFGNGQSGFYGIDTGVTFTKGTWIHIVVTASGTSQKCYVNGSLVSNVTKASSMANNSSSIAFLNETGNAYPAYGGIDEVGIWGRELSGDEVSQLYNGGMGLSYPFITGHNLTLLRVGT